MLSIRTLAKVARSFMVKSLNLLQVVFCRVVGGDAKLIKTQSSESPG